MKRFLGKTGRKPARMGLGKGTAKELTQQARGRAKKAARLEKAQGKGRKGTACPEKGKTQTALGKAQGSGRIQEPEEKGKAQTALGKIVGGTGEWQSPEAGGQGENQGNTGEGGEGSPGGTGEGGEDTGSTGAPQGGPEYPPDGVPWTLPNE